MACSRGKRPTAAAQAHTHFHQCASTENWKAVELFPANNVGCSPTDNIGFTRHFNIQHTIINILGVTETEQLTERDSIDRVQIEKTNTTNGKTW